MTIISRIAALSGMALSGWAALPVAGQQGGGGGGNAPPFPTTLEGCRDQFEERLNDCCGVQDPELRAGCNELSVKGLEQCLDQLDVEQKPPAEDCFDTALQLIEQSCSSLECDLGDVQEACVGGALAFFDWCAGDDAEFSVAPEWFEGTGPMWPEGPGPIVYGTPRTLTVLTRDDIGVTDMSFWLVPIGASSVSTSAEVMRIGDATPHASGFGIQQWQLHADTAAWPIGGRERVVLLARADIDDRPAAVSHVALDVLFDPDDLNRDGVIDILDVVAAAARGMDAGRIGQIARRADGQ